MGLIQSQAIKSTIYTYLGVAIGFVTSALIFPKVLLSEEIGLLGVLVAYSMVFAQFAGLGWNVVTIKVFPAFRDKEAKNHGFLFLLLSVSLTGFLLVMAAFFIVRPLLMDNTQDDTGLFSEYVNYLIPLILFTLLFNSLESYYRSLFNAVIGAFLKEFLQRLLIFASIVLFIYEVVDFELFVLLYVISISLPAVILLASLIVNGEFHIRPNFKFLNRKLIRHMFSVGMFGILSGFAGIVIYNIDRIMIERMIGLSETGIYATTFYFATLVILPSRALMKITAPFIAEAANRNDKTMISILYSKSSMVLLAIGMWIFIGLIGNLNNIFRILPPEYELGMYVIVLIGITNLVDMSTGAAGLIVVNSEYYKTQTYFLLLLIILVIVTNIILIPLMGITGAALASLISKISVNLIRFFFLKFRFGLQPYNYRFFLVLVAGGAAYLASLLLPETGLYMDIILRSTLITVIFGAIVYFAKLEPEWNEKLHDLFRSIRK